MLDLIVIVIIAALLLWLDKCSESEHRRRNEEEAISSVFPDGSFDWWGYTGDRDFNSTLNFLRMSLQFVDVDGVIVGHGLDSGGARFTVEGVFNKYQCVFSKMYDGAVAVDFKAQLSIRRGRLMGMHGSWTTAPETGNTESHGRFRLWMCHLNAAGATPVKPAVVTGGGSVESSFGKLKAYIPIFGVNESDDCVICFDRSIDCALVPCGHMFCCGACAVRFESCPICRSKIHSIGQSPDLRTGVVMALEIPDEPSFSQTIIT